MLDERFQQFGTFHIKLLKFFSVDVSFMILCGLYFIFLVEKDKPRNQPCPWPGLALPSIFIVDPSDNVMSCAKGKAKIPSRSLSRGFTRRCLPLRVTTVRGMKNVWL